MEKSIGLESVDEQLARLGPEDEWRPDTMRALARLCELREKGKRHRTRNWIFATASVAALCVCLLAYPHVWRGGKSAASERILKDGQAAPDFLLKDSTGADVRLSDYLGKAVVLNFWATWCRPCRIEMPMLMELETRYNASGLQVIGVSVDDDGWNSVLPYIAKHATNYPIVAGNAEVAKRFAVEAMPMTVLIDRGGKVASVHLGIVEQKTWESEIEKLLAR